MGFYIRFKDIDDVIENTNTQFNKWTETLEDMNNSINEFTELESFEGEAADAIKAYLNELHKLIIFSMMALMNNYKFKIKKYRQGYEDIDEAYDAEIPEDDLGEMEDELSSLMFQFEDMTSTFNRDLFQISDIIDLPTLKSNDVIECYNHLIDNSRFLRNMVTIYEDVELKKVQELEDNCQTITLSILDELEITTCISSYQPCDIYNSENTAILEAFRVQFLPKEERDAENEKKGAYFKMAKLNYRS